MKHLSAKILTWLLIVVFLAACAKKSAPVKIRIGIDATLPPFETYDMNKKRVSGLDADLMKAIAAKAGLEVELVNVSGNQLFPFIAQCQLDGGISAIPITDELKGQMSFSDPYFTVGQVVVVKKGNILIAGREQLSGMAVGAQTGSLSAAEIQKIAGAQLKSYDSFGLAFQDLSAGYIDAVIADLPRARSYVNIKSFNLKIVGDEFASVPYGIAICSNRADLVQKINDGLKAVKADGTLDRLTKKWINQAGQ